jgi:hypothetical protein
VKEVSQGVAREEDHETKVGFMISFSILFVALLMCAMLQGVVGH